jgi:hypothetical protein
LRKSVTALLLVFAARAETIDRIAVSVGNGVITSSAIDREIRLVAFQQRRQPDFSPANRRGTAERMVDRKLIERELASSHYPPLEESEVEPELAQFRKDFFPAGEAFERALAEYRITEQDFKKQLLWQGTFVSFLDVRFRPGVQVTDQEIQDYFTSKVEPLARAAHPGQTVSLDDYRDQIESTLAGRRADEQRDIWLKEARQRTEVVFHDEAFR